MLQQQADDRALLISNGADPSQLLDLGDREAYVLFVEGGIVIDSGVEFVPCDVYPCTVSVDFDEGESGEPHSVRQVESTFDGGAGSELEEIDKIVIRVAMMTAIGILLILMIIGLLIWRVVGRVLKPVDEITQEAGNIHGGSLDRRVPITGDNDEIDHLATTVNEMLDRIDHAARSQRRFVSNASHEMKSPLANLRAILDTNDPASWERTGPAATAEIDRMGKLVDDLLYLSVLDESDKEFKKTKVQLDDLLFDEIAIAKATGNKVIDAGRIQPIATMGDHERLRRALRNLIDNAVWHASTTARVTTTPGDLVEIVVEDDGHGISESDRRIVFERFGRADKSRARGAGSTGIGLSIVRDVVALHRGEVWVETSELGGARFVVRLPSALSTTPM